MKTELINKIALINYPEFWADEPNNHTMCAKQFDVNKEEREAFIEGINYFNKIIGENLTIDVTSEPVTDYGNVSTGITISLRLYGENISSSSFSI